MSLSEATIATESAIVVVPFIVAVGGSDLHLALNVHKILKVSGAEGAEALPSTFAPFSKVLDFNGTPVPVLDLRRFFEVGKSSADASGGHAPDPRIIICNVQGIIVGIQVDRTRKLERHSSAVVLPAPESLRCDGINPFCAAIPRGDRFTYLLDLETILSESGITLGEEAGPPTRNGTLAGKTILVVEDSKFFQKRCVQIFGAHGAKVDIAANGVDGLAALEAKGFKYDLLLVDIEMPRMNGIQMVKEARRKWTSPIPVVFNSGIANPVLIDEISSSGLGTYLIKFSEAEIIATATKVLTSVAAT